MTQAVRLDARRLDAALAGLPKSRELFIAGRHQSARDGRTLTRVSPAHGVEVGRYALAGPAELDLALDAARTAFDSGPWPSMTGGERARILLKVADLIERDLETIALLDTLESGKPIAQARGEIGGAADIWRYAAGLARDVHGETYTTLGPARLGVVVREPIGVVSIITPWNFPFLIVSQKLPFALAAGCTAVVKPSEMTSASTLMLADLLAEAGLPEGVVNVLVGDGAEIGAPMTADPRVDMVSFTGSTRVGRATMAAAAQTLKKVSMELGGKNPQIVFPDADLDAALDAAVMGAYFNAGECCNAGSRLLLHGDIAEDFLASFVERSREVVVGDPLDEATLVGALITPAHLDQVEAHVRAAAEAGAEVRLGGARLDSSAGQFMDTTVVVAQPGMGIARDEVFGPVGTVLTFSSLEEAVSIANAVDYGLSAGVWSRDFDTCLKASRALRAGTVWTNTFLEGSPELPFGGYRQSGIGRELGRNAAGDYTEEKTLNMHMGPRIDAWLPNGRTKPTGGMD